jgi:zinc-ribbon domain
MPKDRLAQGQPAARDTTKCQRAPGFSSIEELQSCLHTRVSGECVISKASPPSGMAGQFCVKCGTALPAGSAFCLSCGTPTAPAALAAASRTTGPSKLGAPPAPPSPPPPPDPSTSGIVTALGLHGHRSFLVQHQVLSMGHSYRVMDPNKRLLFTVQGNASQNFQGNLLGGLVGGFDSFLGRMEARSVNMSYTLVDGQSQQQLGSILKEGGANQSTFTLTDPSGQRLFVISLQRGLMGGITATASGGDGRPMLQTSGNLVRHNFIIKDAQGIEQAKVHEAWVAIRDTYNVEMLGTVDPVYPLVFTIMLDFEKEK